MYLIALSVDAHGDPQGIKEDVAMRLEDMGCVKVISVQQVEEQMRMEGGRDA